MANRVMAPAGIGEFRATRECQIPSVGQLIQFEIIMIVGITDWSKTNLMIRKGIATVNDKKLGNENQITIDRIEMDIGWVCFQGGDTPPPNEQLPYFLNDALTTWLKCNPDFTVRTVLPLVVEGNTVAINVWFD